MVRRWTASSNASLRQTRDMVQPTCSRLTCPMASTECAYGRRTSQRLVWPSQWVRGRNHSSPYHSHCPWGGQRAHPTFAAPPKPWRTSSIYMPHHPGTHHGILWNLPQGHSPQWMAGTASPLPHPRSRHHHDSRFCHNSPRPSNAITAAQGTPSQLQRFKRQVLHLNDRIFRANDDHDNPTVRKEPISESKLLKGDACWSTTKVVLGWMLDTLRGTIELLGHQKTRLRDILTDALSRKRVSVRAWQKLLGELHSMVLGIPGSHGLFSQLLVALQRKANHRVRIHKEARVCLQELYALACDLAQRPTRMAEIVPTHPLYAGCCDAALAGMGGVWLPSTDPYYPQHPPYVWRDPFPPQVQRELVSTTNPSGTISNSDLELAGAIAHAGALAHHRDIRECTVAIFSDNTPAVVWGTKASVTTMGPAAYLLRTASLHQRRHRYLLQRAYIANMLADIASRRFDRSDDAL